jgi:hypothetical protein
MRTAATGVQAHMLGKKLGGGAGGADLKHQTAWVLLLPETVDHMGLNQVACVLVEMRHEEVNIVQVVELPALRDQGVAEDVSQGNSISVGGIRKISDPGKLKGRLESLVGRMGFPGGVILRRSSRRDLDMFIVAFRPGCCLTASALPWRTDGMAERARGRPAWCAIEIGLARLNAETTSLGRRLHAFAFCTGLRGRVSCPPARIVAGSGYSGRRDTAWSTCNMTFRGDHGIGSRRWTGHAASRKLTCRMSKIDRSFLYANDFQGYQFRPVGPDTVDYTTLR